MRTSHTAIERFTTHRLCGVATVLVLASGCRSESAAVRTPADIVSTGVWEPTTAADAGQTAVIDTGRVVADARSAVANVLDDLSEDEQRFADQLRKMPPDHVQRTYKAAVTDTTCSHFVTVQGVETRDCARTVSIAHAATASGWATSFGRVEFSPFSVTHDGGALWSVATACEAWIAAKLPLDSCREYNSAASYEMWDTNTLRPSSLVGPIVSFANLSSSYGGGGTVNSYAETAYSFDLRTGDVATFDALVTTESLVTALKADSYLKQSVGAKLQDATTVEAVWDLWGVEDFAEFGAYHFHQWSAKRGEVAMRISFLETREGLGPNNLRSLGLWVEPRPQFRDAFEAAANGSDGFLGNR